MCSGLKSFLFITSLVLSCCQVHAESGNAFGVPSETGEDVPVPIPDPMPVSPAPSPYVDPRPVVPSPQVQAPKVPSPQVPVPQAPVPHTSDPAPRPTVKNQPQAVQPFLVGDWHGIANTANGSWNVYVRFLPNGQFSQRQVLINSQTTIRTVGRYSAQFGAGGGVIQLSKDQTELCQGPGNCRSSTQRSFENVRFKTISHDVVDTDSGRFQRVSSR